LPIGVQILGKYFDEPTVLRIGHVVEHAMAGMVNPLSGSPKASSQS